MRIPFMRFLLLLWIFTFSLMANMDIYPKKECELFNNLKHTKNRGHEVLKLDKPYEMLKHHKEQYLIKVEGATPVQRWVDDDCLSLRPLRGTPIYEAMHNSSPKTIVKKTVNIEDELNRADENMAKKPQKSFKKKSISSKKNLLALSWHNAFCETHRYKKECKRGLSDLLKRKPRDTQFVLHGLWPQPRINVYCNVEKDFIDADKRKRWRDLPCLALEDDVEKELEKIMPGFSSDLHKHEWVKHGTCYGTDANTYYKDATSLVKQVNTSALGKFFTKNIGKTVTMKELQRVADKTFGRGTGNRLELRCKSGLVTELWLHLGGSGDDLPSLLKNGKKVHSRCQKGQIDRAGFTKETGAKAGFGR